MRNTVIRLAVLAFAAVSLSACFVAPAPYGGYYGPRYSGYYAAPAPRYYGGYGYGHRGW